MANERYAEFTEETPKSYLQGLFEESSTQKQKLGTIRRLTDGREFIYTKMGATNAVAGQLYQSAVFDLANVGNCAVANANVGDRSLTITPVTVVAGDLTANTFAEGFVYVHTGNGAGRTYKVKDHPTLVANTAKVFALYDKIRDANITNANSIVSLHRHPCKAVIVHPSPPTSVLVGVATFTVTANYYCWLQKTGPCAVENDAGSGAALTIGKEVFASPAANGCITGQVSTANGIDLQATAGFPVGKCLANNANDHWAIVDLKL